MLLPVAFPGYITWEQYLENRERARQNRTTLTTRGSARGGGALLAGILYCGTCGGRMIVRYSKAHRPRYECQRNVLLAKPGCCCGLNAAVLDSLVEREVLQAVEPGTIDLSMRALSDLHQERERLDQNWRQNLERARYESQKAERAYRAVDPENRLVARTLEQQWESTLRKEQAIVEDYDRFQSNSPRVLTTRETEMIQTLAANLPAVWKAPSTNASDKQEVIRCLVERVLVNIPGNNEFVNATITWAGGDATHHDIRRPVQNYSQLEGYAKMRDSIASWKGQGMTNSQIAERLNNEGFCPPTARATTFTRGLVAQLVCRLGLATPRDGHGILRQNEWWLRDLAEKLQIGSSRVRGWITKGYVQSRKLAGGQHVISADHGELLRLEQLRDWPRSTEPPGHLLCPNKQADQDHGGGTEENIGSLADIDVPEYRRLPR